MKYKFLVTLFFLFSFFFTYAQKWELRVNGSVNTTFIPDFPSLTFIANDGLCVPGLISIANFCHTLLENYSISETTPGIGFLADMDLRVKIGNHFGFVFAAGINQMRYDYDTYINAEGTPNLYLSSLDEKYGDMCLLYANVRPFSFAVFLFKHRLSFHLGPTFNILLKSKHNEAVVTYTQKEIKGEFYTVEDKVYFETGNDLSKMLVGAHLQADVKLVNSLYFFLSGQYYFNSVYSHQYTNPAKLDKTRPFNLQAGLGFVLWHTKLNKD